MTDDEMIDDFLRVFARKVCKWDTEKVPDIQRRIVSELLLRPEFLVMSEGWFLRERSVEGVEKCRVRLVERLKDVCKQGLIVENARNPSKN